MAIISGNAKLSVGGVNVGDIVWQEIGVNLTPLEPLGFTLNDRDFAIEPVTLEVEISIEPEALPFVTDLCLQGQLGEHYKN
jgi:hypothetical protein